MNCAFKTEFCMFKVNKSEFNVMVAITSNPVDQNTQKKTKTRLARRPEPQIGESAYPVSPLGYFGEKTYERPKT